MRTVGVVAGLIVALATTPARAQPAQPGAAAGRSSWRAAVKAALAFGYAEGEMAGLKRFAISSAPRTKKEADAVLDDLDQHAQRARDAYLFVERYGSPFWTVAARLRVGDIFWCQADQMVAIPPPRELAPLPPGYMDVFEGLVSPLRDEGRRHWEAAAKESDKSRYWSRVGWERLKGTAPPGC